MIQIYKLRTNSINIIKTKNSNNIWLHVNISAPCCISYLHKQFNKTEACLGSYHCCRWSLVKFIFLLSSLTVVQLCTFRKPQECVLTIFFLTLVGFHSFISFTKLNANSCCTVNKLYSCSWISDMKFILD